MKAQETNLKDAYVITTPRFDDERGFFLESFSLQRFRDVTGAMDDFVQDNHSKSSKGVLRGLHYQTEHPQGKLVRFTQGAVYDVIVDLRKSSPPFWKSFCIELAENNVMFKSWIKDVNEQKLTDVSGVPATQRLVGTDAHLKYVASMVPGSNWGIDFINKYKVRKN